MRPAISIGALALALSLFGCGGGDSAGDLNAAATNQSAPLAGIAAPNNGDWSEVVTQTSDGGVRIGNPEAPVKLVEYASMTCPHCKAFSDEATGPLRDTYIRSGQVSWEFRNFVLNGADMAISVLARCQPPADFFPTVEQLFAEQSELLSNIDEAEGRSLEALAPEQRIASLARAMELDAFFARRGMPQARFNECLANPQGVQQLTEMGNRAMTELQVSGTPTFFINGRRQQASDWAQLQPLLRNAVGR